MHRIAAGVLPGFTGFQPQHAEKMNTLIVCQQGDGIVADGLWQ